MKIKFCKYKSEVLNESDLKYTECLIKVTSSIPLLMALPSARGKKQCLPLIVREQRQWIKISYQKESYDLCIFNEQRKLRLLQNVNRQHDGNCSFSSAVLICNFENISVSANSLLI